MGIRPFHLSRKSTYLLVLTIALAVLSGYSYVQQGQAVDDQVTVQTTVDSALKPRIDTNLNNESATVDLSNNTHWSDSNKCLYTSMTIIDNVDGRDMWSEIFTWSGSILGQLTPRHAFNPTLTTVVAVVVAVVAIVLPVVGRKFSTRRQLLIGGGAAYVTIMLSLWAGVRLVFWRFSFDPVGDAPLVAPVLVAFGLVIAGQFVLPVYLLVAHKMWTPLFWLFGVTWAYGEFVLLVGGESGGLFTLLVWVVGLLPPSLGVLAVTTGGEFLLRRLISSHG